MLVVFQLQMIAWNEDSPLQKRLGVVCNKQHTMAPGAEQATALATVCCDSGQKKKNATSNFWILIVYANYMVIYICMIRLAAILLCQSRKACSIFCFYSYDVYLKQKGQL